MTEPVWVLEDPRAGTAAQALGIAERLGLPLRRVPLRWSRWASLPVPFPTLLGLSDDAAFAPPWPRIAISAGRRAAPVSRWLRRRGVRTVHCMWPGLGAEDFDLLVVGSHDGAKKTDNQLEILGSTHRVTAESLKAAPRVPRCDVALLLGGPVRAEGMDPALAARFAREAAGLGGFLFVTTSRRTGEEASQAVAEALQGMPHHLHRFGTEGPNPYLSLLAQAGRLVVTGDSISMLSEALLSPAPLFVAQPPGLGPRHRRLLAELYSRGLAAPLGAASPPRHPPVDETGRVLDAILARRWL
ncbi:mitochondrial fission ELM1 family protein [Sabulicella glaciei]|uniref:Mitochondrial fission ELM1 family protein n=1 Tax=Sabulicella glaciei TaxID=2984948 RepID=A0ABT3NQY2_9PROT|nr:mitochondrial fission ELM1 family protein [Roseococcus sp. MDT2-1-1]MCW8084570.1 mitochondrial fission ELM1 family protein [Roseococcus sp. MDT2-1-1]